MNYRNLYLLLLISAIAHPVFSWSNIDSLRGIQLDSIVTNIPREIRKDLYLLQEYLHSKGNSDEERVWMYYAVFPMYIHYEKKRQYKRKPKFYTPDYTLNKRKGVCRDQAELFGELCKLSNIPCIQVVGKVPFNIISFFLSLSRFKIPNFMHQWCVVRINKNWHLMDPTWASIESVKKYYSYDNRGNRKTIGKVKIVSRKYYDAIPDFFALHHKPFHPAFYLLANVPTFKSSYKEQYKPPHKRKIEKKGYNFNDALDRIYNNEHPEMSQKLDDESYFYSKHSASYYFLKREMSWHHNLTSRKYKPTLQDYYCHYEYLDSLSSYYKKEKGYALDSEINSYKKNIDTLFIEKLEHKTRNRTKLKKRR